MVMNDENKRHGQAIKIARGTTNNQKKEIEFRETFTEITILIHEDKY